MTSWLTSTLQIVREKSVDALEFVRKDLSEFTTTVKTDTETYLNQIKSQRIENLGIDRIGSKLNDTYPSDHNNGQSLVASASFDRLHSEKRRLETDESTYLVDPLPIEAYRTWCETSNFNVEKSKGDITQLLITAPHVRSLHARLVPACTTYNDFWSRYYFRLHQLDADETRRVNLLKRAHEICNEKHDDDWDGPDEEWASEAAFVNQQSITTEAQIFTPSITVTSNTNAHKRQESDAVSGDSWEREFDETDLDTSQADTIPSNDLPATISYETSSRPTTAKKVDDEFDDEWESWS